MAKRTGGGEVGGTDLRRLLATAVVEYGKRKLVGQYALTVPGHALLTAYLATLELRAVACS